MYQRKHAQGQGKANARHGKVVLFREAPLHGHGELVLASAEKVTNRRKLNRENKGRAFTLSHQSRLQFPTSAKARHSPGSGEVTVHYFGNQKREVQA